MSNNTQEKHAPHFYCLEKKPMRGAFFKMDFSRLGIRASLRGFYGMLTRITVFETVAGAQSRVDPSPWFEVDLLEMHTMSAVATQGSGAGLGLYVESYSLTYSYDRVTWYNYNKNGKPRGKL